MMTEFEKKNRIPLSMLKISFLEKTAFKGSYEGMRYILKKDKHDDKSVLKVYTYKDLFNFEHSKDIIESEFSFDKDGINKAIEYLDKKSLDYKNV